MGIRQIFLNLITNSINSTEKGYIHVRIWGVREYGGLNYKEIGETLGITEGNVKVRVFRAREQLTKLIGEDDVYMP